MSAESMPLAMYTCKKIHAGPKNGPMLEKCGIKVYTLSPTAAPFHPQIRVGGGGGGGLLQYRRTGILISNQPRNFKFKLKIVPKVFLIFVCLNFYMNFGNNGR
jgi:hypothetical protein